MYKAFLLVAAAIWGLGTVVIKSTVDEFPPASSCCRGSEKRWTSTT